MRSPMSEYQRALLIAAAPELLEALEAIAERFVYGTHWPLRLTQNSRANLDLLPEDLRAPAITDARALTP